MSNDTMLIPSKIKVGYNKRDGTYTGRLAYVIYFDSKGVLRKEKSWESWRDKNIDPQEFTNEPTSGFVLNRGVGGVRSSWSSWHGRNEYIRVYDPRDFEFEISVANLLFILQESSSIKGKGLEGEFVYAWDGSELVLLPVDSEEYKSCAEHTERQTKKISAKDVQVGYSYRLKNGTNVLYLGKYNYNAEIYQGFNPIGKRHIFLNLDYISDDREYIVDTGFTKLAESISSSPLTNFPDELDNFKYSKYYADLKSVEMIKIDTPSLMRGFYFIQIDNVYHKVYLNPFGYWSFRESHAFDISYSNSFTPSIENNNITIPIVNTSIHNQVNNDYVNKLQFCKMVVINVCDVKIE